VDKSKLEHIKIYINRKGKRKLTKALIVKENAKTVWVVLKDGNIIKRHKKRDIKGGK